MQPQLASQYSCEYLRGKYLSSLRWTLHTPMQLVTHAIESQLAKTVAEVAEKDEEIALMQHAGEEVQAEHLAADTGNGDGDGGVLDGAVEADSHGSDPTADGAVQAVADSVSNGDKVADAGDAIDDENDDDGCDSVMRVMMMTVMMMPTMLRSE